MARHHFLAGALLGAIICSTVLAQIGAFPVVNPPNFSVSLHAVGLSASGASMASDRFGNVYIVDQTNITATGSVTKVEPGGTVVPQFVSGLGSLSQIAYDPADGYCYIAAWAPILPVVLSNIWRIDPVQGAVAAGSVSLIASGFTIDDAGLMYFGTQTALQGAGPLRPRPSGPSGNATLPLARVRPERDPAVVGFGRRPDRRRERGAQVDAGRRSSRFPTTRTRCRCRTHSPT